MDQVLEDHDTDVLKMKTKTEEMWKRSFSKRERKSSASKDVPGMCFFGDNIGQIKSRVNYLNVLTKNMFAGKVVNQRHNTGLEHKGEYLHMAQVLAIENRVPTAHCRFQTIC